jgi:hypothetical protein
VTLTTERATPLCQWNPGWDGCSTARRPAAAVYVFFLRRSVFVKRFTHEMTLREVPAVRHGRPGALQSTELRSRAQPGCATRIGRDDRISGDGRPSRTRSHSRSQAEPGQQGEHRQVPPPGGRARVAAGQHRRDLPRIQRRWQGSQPTGRDGGNRPGRPGPHLPASGSDEPSPDLTVSGPDPACLPAVRRLLGGCRGRLRRLGGARSRPRR